MNDRLVHVENISFAYPGDTGEPPRPVLRDVSVSIHPGEFIALVGQNGAGKTTLARHLNGLLHPTAGRVLIGDIDARDVPVGELARHVGYVFQNPDHQLFLPTVRAEVAYGPQQIGLSGARLDARVSDTLERFRLGDLSEYHPATLGRGLRRLTALAAIYAMGPRVLVLDEPTGGLDRHLTGHLMCVLHELTADGHAIVLITHEMRLAAEHAGRVIVLSGGRVAADDAPPSVFTEPDLLATANLSAPVVTRLATNLRSHGMPDRIVSVDEFCDAYSTLIEEQAR